MWELEKVMKNNHFQYVIVLGSASGIPQKFFPAEKSRVIVVFKRSMNNYSLFAVANWSNRSFCINVYELADFFYSLHDLHSSFLLGSNSGTLESTAFLGCQNLGEQSMFFWVFAKFVWELEQVMKNKHFLYFLVLVSASGVSQKIFAAEKSWGHCRCQAIDE